MTPTRATVVGAFAQGWRRVLRAPAVTAGVLVATLLLAAPLAFVVRDALEEHLGSSLQANQAATGWNSGWATEFGQQSQGVSRTFTHEILGFGATIAIVSHFVDNDPVNPAVVGAVAAYVGLWVFLSGGILDRLARDRPIRTAAFFAACGVYFLRFLRLAVVVGLAYWALFRWLHPYLFDTLYNHWTREMTVERHAFALRAALYAAFLLPLALVSLVADFAKVRAVVEDRRSMLGALGAAVRFLRRRPLRVVALYLLNAAAWLAILSLWALAAPAATVPVLAAWFITQVYLVVRIWAKLAFMASEVVFFQGELAHADYTAAPQLLWPESPAAEAIVNLTGQRAEGKGQREGKG